MTTQDHIEESLPEDEADTIETALPLPTNFSELMSNHPLAARVEALGFTTPTPVQQHAVPAALEGHDLIVQAQTGSGKTLAFALPLLYQLERAEQKGPISTTFALVIAPTRELALQLREVLKQFDGAPAPVLLIGGVDSGEQHRALKSDPRIVVGTPGRILDFMRQKALKLADCRYFVLDEADEMLSMGFIEDIRAILSRLPDRRQGLFVSATITGRVEMLANSFLSKPKRITVDEDKTEAPSIVHNYIEVGGELMAKPQALCDLIETIRPRSAIIFCNTKSDTKLVEALLRRRGFDARRINSDLTQAQRDRIMKKIRAEELQFLIATDIAARGLDIEQIDLVLNYNIHEQPETYVHRTGRTGRAGRHGRAISLVGPRDHGSFHFLKKVLDFQFERVELPSDEEVAEARLAHLYEMLRQTKVALSDRDNVVSRQLIRELGGIAEPTDELVEVIAKLARHSIEHFINLDAKSLEEELEPTEQQEEPRKRERRKRDRDQEEGRGRDDRRGRDRREDNRRDDDRRSRDRDRDRDEDRRGRNRSDDEQGRGERRGRDRDEERNWEDRRGPRDEERGSDERRDQRSRDRDDDRGRGRRGRDRRDEPQGDEQGERRPPRENTPDEIRLYIGQGRKMGMTPELFVELVEQFAELKPEQLRNLSIREHYGFVDTYRQEADAMIRNIDGIEYNGHVLPIKIATLLTQRRGRQDGGRGRRDDRRDDRRGPRRDRGGESRGGRDRGGRRSGGRR